MCRHILYIHILRCFPKSQKKIENVIFDMNNIKDKNLMKLTIAELRLRTAIKKIQIANSEPKPNSPLKVNNPNTELSGHFCFKMPNSANMFVHNCFGLVLSTIFINHNLWVIIYESYQFILNRILNMSLRELHIIIPVIKIWLKNFMYSTYSEFLKRGDHEDFFVSYIRFSIFNRS